MNSTSVRPVVLTCGQGCGKVPKTKGVTMRVLVCGGRDYQDDGVVFKALDEVDAVKGVDEIIHGGARGADTLAGYWADKNGVPKTVFLADWDTHGKAAGAIRNQQMLDTDPDLVVAFPGGRGTEDMVRRAKRSGYPVMRFK